MQTIECKEKAFTRQELVLAQMEITKECKSCDGFVIQDNQKLYNSSQQKIDKLLKNVKQ